MFAKCGEMSKAQEEGGVIPGSWAPPQCLLQCLQTFMEGRGGRAELFLPLHF